MFDYLIKNATLVDGLGGPPKAGDLAIKDGVIAEIGTISGQAKETINAEELTLHPDGSTCTPIMTARSVGMMSWTHRSATV